MTPDRDDNTNPDRSGSDPTMPAGPASVRGPDGHRIRDPRIRWAVEIREEDTTADGWAWRVRLHPAGEPDPASPGLPEPRNLEVRMSWVDHDHLCHGRMAPSEVIARLLRFAVARMPVEKIPATLDVSRLSRLLTVLGGVDADEADMALLFQREI